MITRDRWLLLGCCLALVLAPRSVGAEETLAQVWKLKTTSVWPPAVAADKLVLKNGDSITAHSLADGKQLWTRKLDGLRYGMGVLDASPRHIYVLGGNALYLLDPGDGHVVRKKAIQSPSSLQYGSDSIYVMARSGVLRFDRSGEKRLARAKGYTGEIRGVDGDHVVLYVHDGAVRRLIVVNLRDGKKAYEFKLLPTGWHQVIKVGNGRVVFIDFSQRQSDGTNPRKLYFTEADYVRAKKLKDQALNKGHPATYSEAACDRFSVATNDSGIVFIGNHGTAGEPSSLLAYDPAQDKLLWHRNGNVVDMGVLLHGGRLWTGIADREGNTHAVAYSPDDGSQLAKLPVDAAGTGSPVAAGSRVLFRTKNAIYCFGASKAVTPAPAPGTPVASAWRTYRDRAMGYVIQAPSTWHLDRAKQVKMGGVRMSTPFFRQEGKTYLGSVHVLTWEAADRDVNTLWSSIYAQRRQLNPDVRVISVHKVNNVGGSGMMGVKAVYSFSKAGYSTQLRSLCVVSHGVAFELRGWAGPSNPQQVWQEIDDIFDSFIPRRFR